MEIFKSLLSGLFIALTTLTFVSCNNDKEDEGWVTDILPIWFEMQVTDSSGNSLLDNNSPFVSNTTVTYAGKEYPVKSLENLLESRVYMPIFYGLVLVNDANSTPYLFFGEFDGAVNTDNETFTINWEDGTSDVISYTNKVSFSGHKVTTERHYYVNGEETDSYKVMFIK